jgi:rSAM/selenodomain-associated transferase 2/rSAM/selenodomain-associated transferase 1
MGNSAFSVIIPALNEAENIGACLAGIRTAAPGVEVIVADGGSRDATAAIAEGLGATVVRTVSCRGRQCNRGAALASGEVLVFLHADTRLPEGAFEALDGIFRRRDVAAGTFRLAFDSGHWFLRLLCFLIRFDMGLFRFGDQGIVVRRSLFDELGGFPEWGLFEDMAFMRAARHRTRLRRFPLTVTTSARRFMRKGVFHQQLLNMYYAARYQMGAPPWKLAESYYGRRGPEKTGLVDMLRLPRPGKVKTRLAGTLGDAAAAWFYHACAGHLLREAEKLPPDIVRHVYYAARKDGKEVRRWAGPRFLYRPQAGGDIGARLKAAFRDQSRLGLERVIAVATDVPDLTAADIERAAALLKEADLVIGPGRDGGYYLIGINGYYPALFEGIAWSTPAVCGQTLAAASRLGLRVASLRCLDDIDTGEDLRRWQARSGRDERTDLAPAGREIRE